MAVAAVSLSLSLSLSLSSPRSRTSYPTKSGHEEGWDSITNTRCIIHALELDQGGVVDGCMFESVFFPGVCRVISTEYGVVYGACTTTTFMYCQDITATPYSVLLFIIDLLYTE